MNESLNSGSSTSEAFVQGDFRHSANSPKIQSWHLTSWNAEEIPDCHGLFCFLCSGISFLLSSDCLLECGRDSCLIHPFSLFVQLAQFMPRPSMFVCLLSYNYEKVQRFPQLTLLRVTFSLHCILRPSSSARLSLDNSLVRTFLGWAKFTPRCQNWSSLFCGIEGHFCSASKTYLLDQQSLTRLVYDAVSV